RAPRRSRCSSGARPYTAGGAASRSRASPRARARRTRGAPRRSLPSAPVDDPAAEAHATVADLGDPGLVPELEQVGERHPAPEALDARPEEAADVGPARRDQPAGEREADARVPPPGDPRHRP